MAKKVPPGGPGKVAKKAKRKPAGPVARGSWRSWARALGIGLTLGALLGVGIVATVLYRGALHLVDERVAGAVWSVPGKVWSGPVEVWTGLATTPADFASDLSAAGYARVAAATNPGDFSVTDDAVLVKPKHETGDILVTFREGRIRSVTPKSPVRFGAALLATMRGPDNENRSPVPLERIPVHMRDAVLAMEDARFFEHEGVDPIGIVRALWVDLRNQRWEQGGSTLTQQLAKNLFLNSDRTAGRKAREMLLAMALEHRLDKEGILHLYLNEIYLGQANSSAVCGVDAAARAWFGKPIERVDVAEAATIAGVIASPNQWSPIRHPEEARARRNTTLDRMVEVGVLEAERATAAKAQALVVHAATGGRRAPYATDAAVEVVEAVLGEGAVARDSLEVHTTLNPVLQRIAELAVAEGMAELVAAHPKLAGAQAAMAVVRASDGGIVALVGGRDYAASNFNRALLSSRSIGSTIKPLTMLAAFESDSALSPATVFLDEPITRTHDGKAWSPANYDGTFVGPIALRRAVALSRNVPAVLLAERVGLRALRDRLHALGLAHATDYPSVALGGFEATPVELAGAYTVFAGTGEVRAPSLARRAEADGIARWTAPEGNVIAKYSARARWLAGDVLRSVMAEGTGKGAAKYGIGRGAAGKSGTTDAYKDAWFAGVAGGYAVVVWIGFDQGEPIGLTGSKAALPTWARFVAATGLGTSVPGPPGGLVRAEVCEATGLPPCPSCEGTREDWFTAGTVPERICGVELALQQLDGRKGPWAALGRLLGFDRDPEAPEPSGGPDGARVPE